VKYAWIDAQRREFPLQVKAAYGSRRMHREL
jgi:hypothetical protein